MEMSPQATRAFAAILESRTGQTLAAGRHWRIETALKPLMRDREIASLNGLAATLGRGGDAELTDAVIDALLNNETSFYRDAAVFEQLSRSLERFLGPRALKRRLRIWCAGCSTGQEAYSLGMSLADDPRWTGWAIDIVGTDVSRTAIRQAHSGCYSQFEIQRGLPVRAMLRWFEPDGEAWRAVPELRAKVRFQSHNLLDPPPSTLPCDIILCRNVLLYLAPAQREAVFRRLASAMTPDGLLLLGAGETVIGQTECFVPDTEHRGLYRLA